MKAQYNIILATLILFALMSNKNSSLAQSIPLSFNISGTVTDSATSKALDFVTVSLKNESKQVIKTSLSKIDGTFLFERIPSGKYSISFISIGYNQKAVDLDLDQNRQVGNIALSASTQKLAEVTVTAERAIIKQESDRISYDMKADPESKSSTVLEIMRKVPLLSVDGEDNLLMSGNKSYKILINGKPSGMMERNAKDILRSMPASSIKNIEVIFSPSSKYDAEGVAGIINIITDKKVDNGYNGSLNTSERFPLGGPGVGGTFTFKQGAFGISSLGGVNQYHSPIANNSNFRNSTGINATNLSQNNSRESKNNSHYLGAEMSYEIDSLNLISGQFNINKNRLNGDGNQASALSNQNSLLQGYSIYNQITENGRGGDAALNYQLGFKSDKARLLTFSYRYLAFENKLLNALDISNAINFSTQDYNQSNIGETTDQTIQIDYVHPINKVSVEAGIKGIFRKNNSDFNYNSYDPATGLFQNVPSRSNLFNNEQNIFSAYNTYQFSLKKFNIKAGLRLEKTIVNADFISASSSLNRDYLSIIPAFSIGTRFKDKSSLNLSYVRRMQRPGIAQLNPFIDRSNPDLLSTGNPDLDAAFTNVIQLNYNRSKKTTISIATAYMFFSNMIGQLSSYDEATKISRTSFENFGQGKVLRSNFYVNYPATNKLNLTFNTDIRYVWIATQVNGQEVNNNGIMAYFNFSSGYRFEKGWRVNANVTINTPNVSGPQTKVNGYINTSLSINKEVIKDKLSFNASVNNPFTKYRINSENLLGPNFTQVSDNRIYYRGFGFGLNYRFGKLKTEIKKNKRSINNDDISGK